MSDSSNWTGCSHWPLPLGPWPLACVDAYLEAGAAKADERLAEERAARVARYRQRQTERGDATEHT